MIHSTLLSAGRDSSGAPEQAAQESEPSTHQQHGRDRIVVLVIYLSVAPVLNFFGPGPTIMNYSYDPFDLVKLLMALAVLPRTPEIVFEGTEEH